MLNSVLPGGMCAGEALATPYVVKTECALLYAGASGTAPPHLAAAQQAASSAQAPPKAARLGAVGRVRHMGLLNGVIPGSSAAAAAVSLYNGNAGELSA